MYLDFAKAFDKIDHPIFINKLKHIGVGGKLLSIIEDYLSNRKQYVEINGTASDLLVLSGVPQGSLLGPLLFLPYIYDVPQNLNCDIFIFADDSKLLSIYKLYEASNLQANLDIIHQWCSKHKMQFNVSNCAHMCFAGSPCQNLTLADEPVPFYLSTKNLGLHVTADLKWNVHIQETTCKAFSALCLLKRNPVEGLSTSTKLKLVKSMVLPILLYDSAVWYASKTNLRKLEQTQWKQLHCSLEEAQSPPLSLYLELNDILLLSNIISNKIDFDWQPFLKPSQRRNQLFDLMRISNDVQHQNFWYRSAKLGTFTPDDKPVSTRRT